MSSLFPSPLLSFLFSLFEGGGVVFGEVLPFLLLFSSLLFSSLFFSWQADDDDDDDDEKIEENNA